MSDRNTDSPPEWFRERYQQMRAITMQGVEYVNAGNIPAEFRRHSREVLDEVTTEVTERVTRLRDELADALEVYAYVVSTGNQPEHAERLNHLPNLVERIIDRALDPSVDSEISQMHHAEIKGGEQDGQQCLAFEARNALGALVFEQDRTICLQRVDSEWVLERAKAWIEEKQAAKDTP